jgi:L-lactate dehydrogenase complex protein LldE
MRASLFITCLSDLFFPQVGEAVVKILRRQNIQVDFPAAQTCCGQPLINSGYKNETLPLAKRFIEIFEDSEYIVTPSGSCALIVKEYPRVLAHDARWRERAECVAARTFEFTSFLVRVLGVTDLGTTMNARVTYHDSCHLSRGLGVRDEPRQLLRAVRGLELVEMKNSDACCGFGGSFSVRYPDISVAMLSDKVRWIEESGAQILVAGDAGCTMNIAGALARQEHKIRVMHIAQLLGEAMSDE